MIDLECLHGISVEISYDGWGYCIITIAAHCVAITTTVAEIVVVVVVAVGWRISTSTHCLVIRVISA